MRRNFLFFVKLNIVKMWQLDEPDSVYQKKRSKSSKVAFKKHTSVQTQKHIHLCTHTCTYAHTHILICTNTHAHADKHKHTHLCTHTHAQIDRHTRTLKYTLSHTRTIIELDVHHLISQLIKSKGARTQVNTCVRAHVICCRVLTLPCYPLFDLINFTKKRPKIKNQFKERKKKDR